MREILFRGKNPYTGEWSYGKLTELKEKHNHIEAGFYLSNMAGMPFAFYVSGDTVGQFTGLLDKNGAKIFEGDILLRINVESSGIVNRINYLIYFEDGCFMMRRIDPPFRHPGYSLYRDYKTMLDLDPSGEYWSYEIIGNIYDTPELLSGEGKEVTL